MLSNNINVIRNQVDNIIADLIMNKQFTSKIIEDPTSVLHEYNIIDEPDEDGNPLYAWIPIPTLLCPSEAGTTSDSCSSLVSCCSPCCPKPKP
ncbi:MAG: hypothetical protein ABSA84_06120 [Gammaproteobacteria bacterium]|jgi:hypothetical protein